MHPYSLLLKTKTPHHHQPTNKQIQKIVPAPWFGFQMPINSQLLHSHSPTRTLQSFQFHHSSNSNVILCLGLQNLHSAQWHFMFFQEQAQISTILRYLHLLIAVALITIFSSFLKNIASLLKILISEPGDTCI